MGSLSQPTQVIALLETPPVITPSLSNLSPSVPVCPRSHKAVCPDAFPWGAWDVNALFVLAGQLAAGLMRELLVAATVLLKCCEGFLGRSF